MEPVTELRGGARSQCRLFPDLPGPAQPGGGNRAAAGRAPAHLSVSTVVQQMNSHPDKPAYQHMSPSLLGLTGEPPDFPEGGSFWSLPRP